KHDKEPRYHIYINFFFSSRRRHTRFSRDWSSDVCSSDLTGLEQVAANCAALGGSAELCAQLEQLAPGARGVADGAAQLGAVATEVDGGAQQLSGGATSLSDGAAQLASGARQVADGATALA